MDELPSDLRAFLLNHPFLQLTDGKKVSEPITTLDAKYMWSHSVMLAVANLPHESDPMSLGWLELKVQQC